MSTMAPLLLQMCCGLPVPASFASSDADFVGCEARLLRSPISRTGSLHRSFLDDDIDDEDLIDEESHRPASSAPVSTEDGQPPMLGRGLSLSLSHCQHRSLPRLNLRI